MLQWPPWQRPPVVVVVVLLGIALKCLFKYFIHDLTKLELTGMDNDQSAPRDGPAPANEQKSDGEKLAYANQKIDKKRSQLSTFFKIYSRLSHAESAHAA